MAFTVANAVSVPSFCGLRSNPEASKAILSANNVAIMPTKRLNQPVVRASSLFEDASKASKCFLSAAVLAASVMATPAMAIDVVMGADDGSLKFIPQEITIAAGEKINFINNAGFPHNVVFDEDEVPEGVDAAALSMTEEDYLNSKGEVYSVTLSKPGTYKFYCAPHQGAGMVGTAIVN